MTRVTISGCQPHDGTYELDLDQELTTREWGWVKRLAGYLPLTLTDDAFGDPELVCVLAVIALRRAGRVEASEVPGVYERLADTPFGDSVTLTAEPEEAEQDPPPLRPSSSAATSGGASPESSATSARPPTPIGTPGSGTSASAPATLAS